MNNETLDHLSRMLGTGAPRRAAAGALALGSLAALSGLHPAAGHGRHGKVSAAHKKKKAKRGPTGPTGPAGAGGGPTGPTGPTGPSAGAVLGNNGVTANDTLTSGVAKTIEVRCPDNTATEQYFATGGGFVTATNEDVFVLSSHQTLDGLGWEVRAHNNNGSLTATVEAWVMCLRVSTGSE